MNDDGFIREFVEGILVLDSHRGIDGEKFLVEIDGWRRGFSRGGYRNYSNSHV